MSILFNRTDSMELTFQRTNSNSTKNSGIDKKLKGKNTVT